jgi:VWFA-related protein
MSSRSVVLAVLACSIASAAAQQEPIPRFRSGVDVVQFTATVLDKDRHPVTGLTASDFEVTVDGKPRPLAAFAAVTLPGESSLAPARVGAPVASDVQTNRLSPEGRLVVIVIDRWIPDGQPMQAAHAIANAAIDRLGPDDIGAVVYTSSASRKYSQGLTTDRARLHTAANLTTLGAFQEPPAPPSLRAPQSQQLNRVQLSSEERSGECDCGLCVIDSLTALAKALTGGMTRQKSILFVGSDISVASRNPAGYCAAFIYPARDRLERALDGANVTFHVVDPRALEGLGDTAELGGPAGLGEQRANAFRQSSLEILPKYTGGRLVVNSNKPQDAVGPIFDESRAYYVLAVARDPVAAGAADQHHIDIMVKRTGAVVRARNVYFDRDPQSARSPAPGPAAAALNELLPRADFTLQMNLAPQFSSDGSTEVRVLLGADSTVTGKLDVLIATFDRVFTPVGTPVKQRLDVPAAAVAGSATFQWSSVLKPPPGDYEVRAAVATADGKRSASVVGYVEVPNPHKTELALSGITVKSAGTATLRRTFAAGEAVGFSFQTAHSKEAKVDARYALRDASGHSLASGVVPPSASGGRAIAEHDFTLRMPAAAGDYVLTIVADNGHHSVHRDVPLTVH